MSKLVFEVKDGHLSFQNGEDVGSFGAPSISATQAFTELTDFLRNNGLTDETPVTHKTEKGFAVLGNV